MPELGAVFWDLDGTIADTEMNGHRVAFNRSFAENSLNWQWDRKTYADLLTISGGWNRIKYYSEQKNMKISDSKISNIHSRKQFHYNLLISQGYVPFRIGVLRLINELSKNKIKQWIVTTSASSSVDNLLNYFFKSIENSPFIGFISSEDVTRLKPDPQAYFLALEKSQCDPSCVIVIEDSIHGLKAAHSANLKAVITISPWIKSFSPEFTSAELVVNHLGENSRFPKTFHGHPPETVVNYSYLGSLLLR